MFFRRATIVALMVAAISEICVSAPLPNLLPWSDLLDGKDPARLTWPGLSHFFSIVIEFFQGSIRPDQPGFGSPLETSTSVSTGAASIPTRVKVLSLAGMGQRPPASGAELCTELLYTNPPASAILFCKDVCAAGVQCRNLRY